MDAFYRSAVGGSAIADALFGAYNRAASWRPRCTTRSTRRSTTSPTCIAAPQVVPGGGGALTPGGRTYRYYTGTPLWPFGWGAPSYTTFALAWGGAPPASPTTLSAGVAGAQPHGGCVQHGGARRRRGGAAVLFARGGQLRAGRRAAVHPDQAAGGFQRVGVPAAARPAACCWRWTPRSCRSCRRTARAPCATRRTASRWSAGTARSWRWTSCCRVGGGGGRVNGAGGEGHASV